MVGEPNDKIKECVQMDKSGAWSDTFCSAAMAPVCEMGLFPTLIAEPKLGQEALI